MPPRTLMRPPGLRSLLGQENVQEQQQEDKILEALGRLEAMLGQLLEEDRQWRMGQQISPRESRLPRHLSLPLRHLSLPLRHLSLPLRHQYSSGRKEEEGWGGRGREGRARSSYVHFPSSIEDF